MDKNKLITIIITALFLISIPAYFLKYIDTYKIVIFLFLGSIIMMISYFIHRKNTANNIDKGYLIDGETELKKFDSVSVTQRFFLSWVYMKNTQIIVTDKRLIIFQDPNSVQYILPISIFYKESNVNSLFTSFYLKSFYKKEGDTILKVKKLFITITFKIKNEDIYDLINSNYNKI